MPHLAVQSSAYEIQNLNHHIPSLHSFFIVDDEGHSFGTTPPVYSSQHRLRMELPSTDPAEMDCVDQKDRGQSPSRFYTWIFLDGQRVDSVVGSYWVLGGVEIGRGLMARRNRIC